MSFCPKLVQVRFIGELQKLYVRSIVIDIQQKGSIGFLYVKPSDIVRTSPATIIIGRIYLNNLDHLHPVRIKLKIKAKVVEVPARKWRYNLQYYCKYPHLKTPKQRSNLKSRLLHLGDDYNLRTCKLCSRSLTMALSSSHQKHFRKLIGGY